MIYKRTEEDSIIVFISESIVANIGFERVFYKYFKDVPERVKFRGLNMNPFGSPESFTTPDGPMIAIRFYTTEDILPEIEERAE